MADIVLAQGESLPAATQTRYKDMEDATHALVIANRPVGARGEEYTQDLTGALTVILYAHHEIHAGSTFLVSYKSADAAPIADDGTVVFAFQTAGKYCHVIAQGSCGGDMEAELREGAAIQGGTGTAMTEYNKNRPNTKVNTATVIRDPTINNAGTLIENEFIPGGTKNQTVGGASTSRAEWVLALNTLYLFRITNRAGNAQPMSMAVEWYEESEN